MQHQLAYERVNIASLKFDPRNARKHDDRNIKAIMDSLSKFGQQKAIVVGEDNIVIAGNGTLEAAKRLGWDTIDVRRSGLKSDEATAYAIADNRSAELAEWDDPVLGDILSELKESGWELDDLGFNDNDLEKYIKQEGTEGLTDEDDVPEVAQNEFGVKRGDIWQLGNHRLMCGDSTSNADVEKLMDGQKADFCFTSPPYSDQREYNGGKDLNTKKLATFLQAPCDLFAVNLGMQRKNNEVYQYWDDYISTAKEFGHKFLSWNIWNRSGFGYTVAQATAMFCIDHEWIFIFGKNKKLNKTVENKQKGISKKGTIRQADGSTTPVFTETKSHRQLGTVITMDIARYTGETHHVHPAMFPVGLPEAYINACSDNNSVIYEPFTGSGSTLIACEKTGRKCYGMELDEHYCSIIIKRWQDFTGKKAERIVEGA